MNFDLRRIAPGATACLVALALTGCGSGSSKASSTTPPNSPAAPATGSSGTTTSGSGATTTPPGGGHSAGHLGDTLTHPDQYDKTDIETVTLTKIVDPATAASAGVIPDPGSRFVGLVMTFSDNGANAANAQDQALATGSDGKVYAMNADIESNFVGCKSTLSDLKPNQKATFCPAFLLPTGVKITKVGYSVRGVETSIAPELTWTVP